LIPFREDLQVVRTLSVFKMIFKGDWVSSKDIFSPKKFLKETVGGQFLKSISREAFPRPFFSFFRV